MQDLSHGRSLTLVFGLGSPWQGPSMTLCCLLSCSTFDSSEAFPSDVKQGKMRVTCRVAPLTSFSPPQLTDHLSPLPSTQEPVCTCLPWAALLLHCLCPLRPPLRSSALQRLSWLRAGGGTPPIPAPTPTSPSPCLELSLVPRKPTSPRAPKNARACPQGTFTH